MSLLGSTRAMAVGTVASRATGFLRTATIAAVLGVGAVGDAYNVANTTPNIVYDLLLGGVLTSVVVPLLVRAARSDPDGGEAYAQRLLSLVVLVLGGACLLLVLGAPLLLGLYADGLDRPATDLAVLLARFFLPQVLFYGVGAVLGAVLNVRGSFAAPMWAPVLNNVVVIASGLLFLLVPGPRALTAGSVTTAQVAVLGIGTTLGIVAQTVALLPALRAVGFRLRLRADLRGVGLARAGSLAGWVLVSVAVSQAAYVVVVRLSSAAGQQAPGRGYSAYTYAYVLWQLPHAIVAVSVITALLPRMSGAAADGQLPELRRTLNEGLRLTVAVLVPAAVAYLVLGRSLATVVFAHRQVSVEQARFLGVLLGVFALGLVPFSAYQLQLRSFYALQDTRTPTLVNLVVSATMVVLDVVLYALLPPELKVAGLAAGHAASFVVGLVVCSRVLRRRTGVDRQGHVLRTAARCLLACVPGALAAGVVVTVVEAALGPDFGPALLALTGGGGVLLLGYLPCAHRLRVPEVQAVTAPLLSRLQNAGRSADDTPAPAPRG